MQRLRGEKMSLVQKQYHCSWSRVNSHFSSSYYFNFCKIMIIIAANVYLVYSVVGVVLSISRFCSVNPHKSPMK